MAMMIRRLESMKTPLKGFSQGWASGSGAAGGFAAKAEEARKTEATARSLMVFVMMCSDCVVARVRP